MQSLNRSGITLIELLVALAVIAILAAAAMPRLDRARARAMGVALAADLHRLEFLQEQHRSNGHPSYTRDFSQLGYVAGEGVSLTITEATPEGWSAVATHQNDPEVRCAVFLGGTSSASNFPAQQAGRVACAQGSRLFGIPPGQGGGGKTIIR